MLLLDVIIILGLIAVLSPQRQVDPFDMLPNMKTERLEISGQSSSPQFADLCSENKKILMYYKRLLNSLLNHIQNTEENPDRLGGKININMDLKTYQQLKAFLDNNQTDNNDNDNLDEVDKLILYSLHATFYQSVTENFSRFLSNFSQVIIFITFTLIALYVWLRFNFRNLRWTCCALLFLIINFIWLTFVKYKEKVLEKQYLLEDYYQKCIEKNDFFFFLNFNRHDKCNEMKRNALKDVIYEMNLLSLVSEMFLICLLDYFKYFGLGLNTFYVHVSKDLAIYEKFFIVPFYTGVLVLVIFFIVYAAFVIFGIADKVSVLRGLLTIDNSNINLHKSNSNRIEMLLEEILGKKNEKINYLQNDNDQNISNERRLSYIFYQDCILEDDEVFYDAVTELEQGYILSHC